MVDSEPSTISFSATLPSWMWGAAVGLGAGLGGYFVPTVGMMKNPRPHDRGLAAGVGVFVGLGALFTGMLGVACTASALGYGTTTITTSDNK